MKHTKQTDSFAVDSLPPKEQWPQFLFELPALHYPAQLNCATELLDKAVAAGLGGKPAVRSRSETWTYAELADKVNRIAGVLAEDMKLVPGSRVLLRGANQPMMAASILAVWKAGCIAVPTMPLLRAPELAVIIEKARIGAALCADGLREEMEKAREQGDILKQVVYFGGNAQDGLERLMESRSGNFAAAETSAEDVCLIAFTSGTTGKPKGTMHFHRDILAACDCFPKSILQVQPDDVFIGTPPLAFTFGLGGLLLFPLRAGATAVLLEKLTPETLMQAVQEFRTTVCFTAPTFYRQMIGFADRYDISSLKKSVSAGEALPTATRDAWQRATGIEMIDGIGSTEMLHIFISAAGADIRPGAVGKPVPGYQACVLDDEGRPLGPGAVGRLAVRGPTGCRYLSDPRQADYVQHGWNLTGDAFEMDADGYFWYRARTDDMIISAGYNIAGPEVEDALLKHPAVAECAVIGAADEERGQIVKAYVVLRPGNVQSAELTRQLQDHVKQSIAPYKYPRAIEYRDALPRTETGKLQRFKLRQETN
ncbi:AMP-binding protein [Noviherbaspirillum sp. CPCC 100848]|uniref:AMP-binding protein n=1 Tax=Noviherbaspirillum album TaxID=3080276 RepID=A0ABU6J8Z9_9BURK|nr:AMP-binding protein [Noviherbaspirillum sp. CPCC 100848]MEC4719757.1 AMP-binding protein [Noviherbaspirillum sp. CPCC 100848]